MKYECGKLTKVTMRVKPPMWEVIRLRARKHGVATAEMVRLMLRNAIDRGVGAERK